MERLLTAAISSLFPAVLTIWTFRTWRPHLLASQARAHTVRCHTLYLKHLCEL